MDASKRQMEPSVPDGTPLENSDFSESGCDPRLCCCVVWTQMPLLTWIFPALGHVGVCDSRGVVYDFQGTFFVGRGDMLFGLPRQRWRLDVSGDQMDSAIREVSREFGSVGYNILCSNCHLFVASVLDRLNVKTPCGCCAKWTKGATAKVAWAMVIKGRSLSVPDFLLTWVPFLLFYGIIILIIVLFLSLNK